MKTVSKPFFFQRFIVRQDKCAMKVGTDGVLLGAWANVQGINSALDIGSGSGLIALMLGQRTQDAEIHAVEIEKDAFEQTAANFSASPWAGRLKAFHTPIQKFMPEKRRTYDLIVSNPPFFSGGTFSLHQDRNNVRHTIKLPHGDLLAAARDLLSDEGRFNVILPHIEGLRFREIAASYHLFCTRLTEVRPRPQKPVERVLLQFERRKGPQQNDELVIQEADSDAWTAGYRELTGDFYLSNVLKSRTGR